MYISEALLIFPAGLTALRNHLSIRPSEDSISPQDKRLLLVQHYLQSYSAGAQELFDTWVHSSIFCCHGSQNARQHNSQVPTLVMSILASMLSLLTSHHVFHSLGYPILKTLLQPPWTRKLNFALSGSANETILVCLKLYNAMSDFGGGKERGAVLEVFPWEGKFLPKLLKMRRRTKDEFDPLVRPDIRTYMVLFMTSPFSPSSLPVIKSTYLEQHSHAFPLLFKGLAEDHCNVVKHVFETFWTGLWGDLKVSRTLKINLFNENNLMQILKLYDVPADNVRDLVHYFMLAICTRQGGGVCFKDNGWYPREVSDDGIGRTPSSRIHNRILANIVKSLKVNEDPLQQVLALKIFEACPELVSGYWSSAGLTTEPRPSSKWLTNVAFMGTVLSLAVPSLTFRLDIETSGQTLYKPSPPPLQSVVANIVPTGAQIKLHLTKGLQHSSSLVQHATAVLLVRCLSKYEAVQSAFSEVARALGEHTQTERWTNCKTDLAREMRKRLPDYQVILAFSRNVATQPGDSSVVSSANGVKQALLAEIAQRLLWLYHHCLPDVVKETRVDIGKALINFHEGSVISSNQDASVRLDSVRQIHVLRLLEECHDFVWDARPGGSSHSYLYILLAAFTSLSIPEATRVSLRRLLRRILGNSVVFNETPHEPELWLDALPVNTSDLEQKAELPEGVLWDDASVVLDALDSAVHACMNTPYRYLDMLQKLREESSPGSAQSAIQDNASYGAGDLSPLLMAFFEQLRKIGLDTPPKPSTLWLVVYIRKVVCKLSTTAVSLDKSFFDGTVKYLRQILSGAELWLASNAPITWKNICKQLDLMSDSFERRLRSGEVANCDISAMNELDLAINNSNIRDISFDWLLFATDEQQLRQLQCRQTLTDILFSDSADLSSMQRAVSLVLQILESSLSSSSTVSSLLLLLASIMEQASLTLGSDVAVLKRILFAESTVKPTGICYTSSLSLVPGITELVAHSLNAAQPADRALVWDFTRHWTEQLLHDVELTQGLVDGFVPWLRFTPYESLVALLQPLSRIVLSCGESDLSHQFIEPFCAALHVALCSEANSLGHLFSQFDCIITLRSVMKNVATIDAFIAAALRAALPIRQITCSHQKLSDLINDSERRWSARNATIPKSSALETFLDTSVWTDDTVAALSAILYKRKHVATAFMAWLQSAQSASQSTEHMALVLFSFLDSTLCNGSAPTNLDWHPFISHCLRLLQALTADDTTRQTRTLCVQCLRWIWPHVVVNNATLMATMKKEILVMPLSNMNDEVLSLCFAPEVTASSDLRASLLERGLQWSVDYLATQIDETALGCQMFQNLLTTNADAVQGHFVETIMTLILQRWMAVPGVLEFATVLVKSVKLKPLVVNRFLQSIVQSPTFPKIGLLDGKAREALVSLLHVLFHLHPANTCQVTHVLPLVSVYQASLSSPDLKLLSIFQLFENQKTTSVGSIFSQWSSRQGITSSSSLDALQSLDPAVLFRTCLHFPKWREFGSSSSLDADKRAKHVYDPVFVLSLFSQALEDGLSTNALTLVELFRTNIISLFVRALSSRDLAVRTVAITHLAALWTGLADIDMQEKPHVLHVLSLLKNTILSSSQTPRIPSYITLLMAHALRAIFYPSNFIYPLTARFLLQRPSIDVSDVPLLYGMLYSSSDEWKKERVWIIRFLADGMLSTDDWLILKRRHTWDLLCSLFHSSSKDKAVRLGVLEVLANITCNSQAATSLILKSGLISWIESQLQTVRENERTAWIKILENIMTVPDAAKLETLTQGQWRQSICRCLTLLCANTYSGQSLALISFAVLRLTLLHGSSPVGLRDLLARTIEKLGLLENGLSVMDNLDRCPVADLPCPPYSAWGLHDVEVDISSLAVWGRVVEALWRVSMALDGTSSEWSALTSRLLVWRSLSGVEMTPVGEWARIETVRNLCL
ncbi:hypothetical protein FISHEDRAFT_49590 [Fistulina hepatica ATCC 64428]|uniref:Nucleolar pre-ribosomal-associated protein 1 C-terminal domain-containing protein n=1 Tax=Fistulina hepatica ATCC 64428 TaxID=1128425 RepID=A0A0D7A2J3_9AGAR|nr:hypothetical protein FISHEDRAFT_49590 [Fistulina hepatica ATCC 64428]